MQVKFVALLVVQGDPATGLRGYISAPAKFIQRGNNVGLLRTLHTNVGVPVSHRRLRDDAEDFAAVDGLAFLGQNAFDGAALWRADFVLHLHGFDNQKALAGFDAVSCFDEKTHDFARHGRHDLLATFGFDVAVATAAPGARIDDFGREFLRAGLQYQFAVRTRRHGDFEGLAVEQNGERVGSDLDG